MRSLALVLGLAALLVGCKMTPEEIEKIQVENELLRQQIQVIRQNCEYYRDLELRSDDPETEPR
jgi:hypothetical protein